MYCHHGFLPYPGVHGLNEDINSIQAENANKTIQGSVAISAAQFAELSMTAAYP